jgi:hypothetical protein
MPQMEEQLKRLQDKLQQVVQQYQLLRKENDKLKQEMQEEKSRHLMESARVDQMRQQVEILKSSKGEMNTEEKKTMERRLNQYVKEIDKCITILNE